MTVGKTPHVILGQEMLKPRDGAEKDEGELTGGKKLIRRLKESRCAVSECPIYQYDKRVRTGCGDPTKR